MCSKKKVYCFNYWIGFFIFLSTTIQKFDIANLLAPIEINCELTVTKELIKTSLDPSGTNVQKLLIASNSVALYVVFLPWFTGGNNDTSFSIETILSGQSKKKKLLSKPRENALLGL